MDYYSNLFSITYWNKYNQAELKQLSRTAGKILDTYNHSHILDMQKIGPETNTEHLITWETRIQDQLSRTAAKIFDAYNHSHILAMQEITPETNTEHLITWETKIQDIRCRGSTLPWTRTATRGLSNTCRMRKTR